MSGENMQKNENKKDNLLSNLSLQFFLPESRGINWDIATSIALNSSNNIPLANRSIVQDIYSQSLELIEPLVGEVSALKSAKKAEIFVVDREEWIVNTFESISKLFDDITSSLWDVLEKQASSVTKKTTQVLATTEIGLLLGFIAQKVLGQYDLGLHSKEADDYLFVIEQNITQRETELGVLKAPLRLWILAHELTHRLQFENFGWFKDYYLQLIKEVKNIVSQKKDSIRKPLSSITFLLNKENLRLISKIQAFMSFIEGYAEFVMFRVGKNLPHYERLKPVFSRVQQHKPFLKKLLEKIIGLDMKTSQYRQGLAFVSRINELESISFLNESIDEPAKIPTMAEIARPKDWLERVGK